MKTDTLRLPGETIDRTVTISCPDDVKPTIKNTGVTTGKRGQLIIKETANGIIATAKIDSAAILRHYLERWHFKSTHKTVNCELTWLEKLWIGVGKVITGLVGVGVLVWILRKKS